MAKYESYYKDYLTAIEQTLEKVLPPQTQHPGILHEAMRYSVFPGGKRFRPVLALAACEATGGKMHDALYAGAAIELIHAYSLVHDDLPSLDNDEMRRGKLSCHKRFGEANALLAGDALLTLAFQVLTFIPAPDAVKSLILELSTASGSCGMIGGQVADLDVDRDNLDLPMLDYISIHKTGKLIKASAVMGAIASKAPQTSKDRMEKFGELLGMAFQSIDDMIDRDGYAAVMKSKEIRDKARDLIAKAKREIKPLGKKAVKLQALADYLANRIPGRKHVSVD